MKNILMVIGLFAIPVLAVIIALPSRDETPKHHVMAPTMEKFIATYAGVIEDAENGGNKAFELGRDVPVYHLREAYKRSGKTVPAGLDRIEREQQARAAR